MACACGKSRERRFSSSDWEDVSFNSRNMVLLSSDSVDCAPYTGAFQGTSVHLVGQGTEYERIFLRRMHKEAVAYATANGVKVGRLVSVRSLCHDTVVATLGA